MNSSARTVTRRAVSMALVFMLILSFTACFAASFSKSHAGVKYSGKTFKLGSTVSPTRLKQTFGAYKRYMDDGCTFGYATYQYKFSKKGLVIETLQKKKGGSEQIISITLTKSTVPTVDGLKVGYKLSKFGEKLGTKCQKSGSTYRYVSGDYYMYLYTKDKKVTKIGLWKDL